MPYVLVETIDAIGNKELLAAPETWIQRNDDGTVYLCWPNIRNITMLNKLLADERSSPTTEWELHKCVIKCSNIQSLSVAGKMIKTLQNHWKSVGSAQKRAIEADDNLTPEPACKKSPINSGARQHAQANSKNVHTEELDPEELQVIGMFNELRNLIQNKHAEARKKLHDGLYRVHKSLHSLVDVSPMTDSQNKEQEVVSDNAPGCSGIALEFYVNPLTCIDEMVDFEERLNDEDYRKQVQTWIDCTVDHESHSERRMRGILDSLFDQQFLSNFSWNGGNTETHAFMKYENIVNLFKYAGTIAGSIVTTQCVQEFLTKILQAGLTAMEKKASPSLVPIDSKILLDDVTVLQTVECTNENTLTDDNDSQKMPFAVVETIGDADKKQLLAVPENWTVCKNEEIGFFFWPNVTSASKLKELLQDEYSSPSALWEKQLCKIIYRSIPSLTSAEKTVEILQKQYKMNVSLSVRQTQRNETDVSSIPLQNSTPDREVRKVVAGNRLIVNELEVNPQQDQDPFGNLPLPELSQTVQNKAPMEQVFSFCSFKEEKDPFGDIFTVASRPNQTLNKATLTVRKQDSGSNMKNASSHKTRQSVVDPLEVDINATQLYDLMYDLKSIMIKNQEEIKQNIREGFNRVQQAIRSMMDQNEHMQSNSSTKSKKAETEDFSLEKLKTAEDVKRFDTQLRNVEYRNKIQSFVDNTMHDETRPRKRMKIVFDLIFHTKLFLQCNWSGKHGKHPLKYYYNIRLLFENIGSSAVHRINQADVSNFFIKTIQNKLRVPLPVAAATTVVNATESSLNFHDNTIQITIPSDLLSVEDETIAQNDTVEEAERNEQEGMIEEGLTSDLHESMEQDEGSVLEEEHTLPQINSLEASSDNSLPEACVNRITSFQELDAFENQLNDVKVKLMVHKWIEETVGLENDVDKRMVDLLDRMPYILVEMTDPAGGKELLAAPATWIQRQEEGSAYLCWPYARSLRKLNALFEDEYSIPTEIWERYECEILCRNIPSLESADKMIETMETQYEPNASISQKETPEQAHSTARHRSQSKQQRWTKSQTNHQNVEVQKLFARINTLENDPLGDVKPCPQLLDLMYELKSMIQSNQEELRKKLREGFGQVEKSLLAKRIESNAMQYAMERMESNAQVNLPMLIPLSSQFKVELLTDMEELEKFEVRLNDEEYLKKVRGWIDTTLGLERDSEHRMHTILDLIISRRLFAGFSWTGAGKEKRPMYVHKNILGLFEYAGTTPMQRVDHIMVENFMRKKLHNSATRVKVLGVRKSVPHRRKRLDSSQTKVYHGAQASKLDSSARAQRMESSTSTLILEPKEEIHLEQSSSSSRAPSPDNPNSAECVEIKQDVTMYMETVNDYEEMWDYRRLPK
uniref:DUF4806 domain-containing protein n=1 Tax=Anopheles culicifacies TaxID=139723 RepID=A0A182LRB2_9DIPT